MSPWLTLVLDVFPLKPQNNHHHPSILKRFSLEVKQTEIQFLWKYAQKFPPHITARGTKYFKEGAVLSLDVDHDDMSANAIVVGSKPYHVWLDYFHGEGWESSCECPYESEYCKHVYAVILMMLSLFQKEPTNQKSKFQKKSHPSVLIHKLKTVLKRDLNAREYSVAEVVAEIYLRLAQGKKRLTGYELYEMGIFVDIPQWQELDLWDDFPKNDHLFWLHIVAYCRINGFRIPASLDPVSDTAPIDEHMRTRQRKFEVSKWNHVIKERETAAVTPESSFSKDDEISKPKIGELQLRFLEKEAVLEFDTQGNSSWKQLTRNTMSHLREDLIRGEITFSAHCESLLNRMHWQHAMETRCVLVYQDPDDVQVLKGILTSPTLIGKCVNKLGHPFKFNWTPLKWMIREADSNEFGDYELLLVDSNERPVSSPMIVLDCQPSLLLFDDQWRLGPSSLLSFLSNDEPCTIPKEVVESDEGVRYFTQSGVYLPDSLQARVQIIELQPVICCRLHLKGGEECHLEIFAEDPKGTLTQVWDGENWRKREKSSSWEGVIVYSGRKLACIPKVLEPLKVRRINHYDRIGAQGKKLPFYRKSVTRAFPQQFFDWLEGVPPEVEVRLEGEMNSFRKQSVSGSVHLDVVENDVDWFDVQLVVDVKDTELSKEEIKLLLAAKGKWVRMGEKGWRRLLFQLDEDDNKDLASLGISPEQMTGEHQRFHALQLANPVAKKFMPKSQAEMISRRGEEIQTKVQPDIPKSIHATLRPYQLDGFHFLAYLSTNRFGGILADDMGLGKTLQTLAWLEWLRQDSTQSDMSSLVVCPKSVMENWRFEAERFVSGLKVRVWAAAELGELQDSASRHHLHIINYNQLRMVGELLGAIPFLAIILDEGQNIKNPSSQTSQIARELNALHRLVLTGTPIENHLLDLWSLMAFAMPGVLGSRNQFGKLYNAKEDPYARLRLSARVRPFLIRRTKSQVAKDLPDRIEEDLLCEMEGTQKTLYQAEQKRAQQMLLKVKSKKELDKLRFNFLTSLLRLRQICCHPKLIQASSKAKSAKLQALLEQLEPIIQEGNKILVFSQFVEMLSMIETELEKKDWKTWMLTGKTENRGELVKNFQHHEGAGVFLISLKAGGSGLNLTAASYVVLFDPWWNPAVENQAIDRTHRIGQKNSVVAYRFLIKNSIEEKIRKLQAGKKSMAEDVLGEEKFAAALSLEDFEFLFS